jgi:hypothetical protein
MMDGWMDGWNGMDFVRKVSTSMAKRKRKVWYYPPPKERWGCTALYSRGQRGVSVTAGTSGMRAKPPSLWALPICCWRSRCSCSACIVPRICSCCTMNSDVFGLEERVRGGINVGTERETPRVGGQNVPHPENVHDGFPTTDFFLSFPFCDL